MGGSSVFQVVRGHARLWAGEGTEPWIGVSVPSHGMETTGQQPGERGGG